jgi:hypothetical protein
MTDPTYCTTCEQTVHPTHPHSCFSAAAQRAHRDAERAVIEAAKVAEMTLTSMAHAEAMYGGQLADQVLDLLDAIKELRALEGDA